MAPALAPSITLTEDGATRTEAREALGWPHDRYVVIHTGTMDLRRNTATVIEAARLLPDGVDVLLIGDGPHRAALQELSYGLTNLCFVDPPDDMWHALALASANLLLTEDSGTGTPEALAASVARLHARLRARPAARPASHPAARRTA